MTETGPASRTDLVPTYQGMPAGKWHTDRGIRTWYCEQGSGAPVVFVHGGTMGLPRSLGSYDWAPCLRYLPPTLRAITVDKLGEGYSDGPADASDFTMQDIVDQVITVIEGLGIAPAHLVGHSRGGYVVARVALQRQELVRSLTLVDSGTLSPGIGTAEVGLASSSPEPTRENIVAAYRHWFYDSSAIPVSSIDSCVAVSQSEKYRSLVKVVSENKTLAMKVIPHLRHDKRLVLAQLDDGYLQRPVQVIWALEDPTADAQRGMALYQMLRRHERRVGLSVIAKSGHFPFVEHPSWFGSAVARFIDRVENDAI